ncbi:MAG: hypothetical protein LUC85_04120 [Bacteroidales bacterium]|nr:hypothetical protein [Bacteroidales bacterium]MCD8394006.1 hypothetical protein [Bacteroidales bacterium]
MLRFLKNIFQLLISPANGWEDISAETKDPAAIASQGLYPLLGFAALTAFFQMLWISQLTVTGALQNAIIIFVQYFITFFLAQYALSLLLKPCISHGEVNEKKLAVFVSYSLALMALITIIENLLPMELLILQFLPIVVAVVIWKGARFMGVETAQVPRFTILSILLIIGPPLLLGWLFSCIIR